MVGQNHGSSTLSSSHYGGGGGGGGGHSSSNHRRKKKSGSSSSNNHSSGGGSKHGSGSQGTGGKGSRPIHHLLARGWTARSGLHPILTPLKPDEMEKDLRHMEMYANAVQSYQQQYYMQLNRLPATNADGTTNNAGLNGSPSNAGNANNASGNNGGNGMAMHHHPPPLVSMPVRIDPEEEKRLHTLRKKIAKAELLREQAEQEYVASQAHYVHTAKLVRQRLARRQTVVGFLQSLVRKRANVVAYARLRLEMSREVHQALKRRLEVLKKHEDETAGEETSTTTAAKSDEQKDVEMADAASDGNKVGDKSGAGAASATNSTSDVAMTDAATGAVVGEREDIDGAKVNTDEKGKDDGSTSAGKDDDLTVLWTQVEDEWKKALAQRYEKRRKGAMVWPATMQTSTPCEVPLLLSNISNLPDKSVAFGFGPDPSSLVWRWRHLKKDAELEGEADPDNEEGMDSIEFLKKQVKDLEHELVRERRLNQDYMQKIAAARGQNDQWVAMMSLVRQETESLLHRHNTLMESDVALEASERLHQQELKEEAAAAAAVVEANENPGNNVTTDGSSGSTRKTEVTPAAPSGNTTSSSGETGKEVNASANVSSNVEETGSAPATSTTTGASTTSTTHRVDEANDGDDEGGGSNNEEEEDGAEPNSGQAWNSESNKQSTTEGQNEEGEVSEEQPTQEGGDDSAQQRKRRKV